MERVKFIQNPVVSTYSYKEESNMDMFVLGKIFEGNFSCSYLPYWAENEKDGEDIWVSGIRLEIQKNDILFKDMCAKDGEVVAELRMQKKWFIKLCNEWRNLVRKVVVTPKELEIICEKGEYRLEVTKKTFNFKDFICKVAYAIFNEKRDMEIVKFIQDPVSGRYSDRQSSNEEMYILGLFFKGDFSPCDRDWAIKATDGDGFSKNCISLRIEENDIILEDMYPEEEEVPASIRMRKTQFIKLCKEWMDVEFRIFANAKVLAIVCENGRYWLQIKKGPFNTKAFMRRAFYETRRLFLNKESITERVNFVLNEVSGEYLYAGDSSIEMLILGIFFRKKFGDSFVYDWAVKGDNEFGFFQNGISAKIERDDILLQDAYPEAIVRIKRVQFIQLFDDWRKAIYSSPVRPKELAILYKNGEYWVEVTKESFSFKTHIRRLFYS